MKFRPPPRRAEPPPFLLSGCQVRATLKNGPLPNTRTHARSQRTRRQSRRAGAGAGQRKDTYTAGRDTETAVSRGASANTDLVGHTDMKCNPGCRLRDTASHLPVAVGASSHNLLLTLNIMSSSLGQKGIKNIRTSTRKFIHFYPLT